MELTARRAKPAVYFGGKSRIIDFALSNAFNSGIRRISVATQYKAHSLIRHHASRLEFPPSGAAMKASIFCPPASAFPKNLVSWHGGRRATRTSDIIEATTRSPHGRFAGDHVYKMDYELMLHQHADQGADVTVACIEFHAEASGFGVMDVDRTEKSSGPSWRSRKILPRCPESPTSRSPAWASMFSRRSSCWTSCGVTPPTPTRPTTGKDIIPYLVKNREGGRAQLHELLCPLGVGGGKGAYWRDVGTVDAYWSGQLDFDGGSIQDPQTSTIKNWPIWTYAAVTPPAKFVHDEDGRRYAISSLVSGACIVSGASLRKTLLSTGARVNSFATVENAVILSPRGCRALRAFAKRRHRRRSENPEGLVVGEDPELNAKRFRRTEHGICLITQPMIDKLLDQPSVHPVPARESHLTEAVEEEPAIMMRKSKQSMNSTLA